MSEGLWSALIGGSVSLVGGILLLLGVRFTARQSTKAKKEEIESGAYTRAQGIWEAATSRQDKELTRLAAALDEQEQRHRRQITELREERHEQITALNKRLDELEAQRSADRRLIESLTSYIRALLRLLRDREIVPPAPPPGMHFDD